MIEALKDSQKDSHIISLTQGHWRWTYLTT
jgi:hypothetical protein